MSDRSDESEAADESSSDDDAATKDRGVPGPLRDPLRGDATGVERHRGVERPLGVTGPLRGDAAGRRRRQTRVATGATYTMSQGGRSTVPRAPGSRTWQSSVPSARFTTRSSKSTGPNGELTGHGALTISAFSQITRARQNVRQTTRRGCAGSAAGRRASTTAGPHFVETTAPILSRGASSSSDVSSSSGARASDASTRRLSCPTTSSASACAGMIRRRSRERARFSSDAGADGVLVGRAADVHAQRVAVRAGARDRRLGGGEGAL
jgi:hypothetical protein